MGKIKSWKLTVLRFQKRRDVVRHIFEGESYLLISGGLQYGGMSILLGELHLERIEKLTPVFW